jgi:hypothetical protein
MPSEPFYLLPTARMSATEQIVWLSIAVGNQTVDEIHSQTGIAHEKLGSIFRKLERRGKIVRTRGCCYARRVHSTVVRAGE